MTAGSQITQIRNLPAAHDLLVVHPDVELGADDVDVRRRPPVGAGVRAVRIAERDVHAGELLVLQDVADDAVKLDVRADRELADAVAVLVGVRVGPEVVAQRALSDRASTSRLSSMRIVSGVSFRLPYRSHSQSPTTPSMTNVPLTSPGVVKTSPPGRLPHFSGVMRPLVLIQR